MKKTIYTITIIFAASILYYWFKSSQIDSNRLLVVETMKALSETGIKVNEMEYKKLLDAIKRVGQDGKITYFEYDELIEVKDKISIENLRK